MYVENMLRLESGDLGEYVRSAMLSSVVDLLIDLDVRRLEFLLIPASESIHYICLMMILYSELLAVGDWMG